MNTDREMTQLPDRLEGSARSATSFVPLGKLFLFFGLPNSDIKSRQLKLKDWNLNNSIGTIRRNEVRAISRRCMSK